MATNYQVKIGKNGAVVVVLHAACRTSKDAILALLGTIALDLSKVSFVEPEDLAECGGLDGTPVIIPLDNGNCDLPEMEDAGRRCASAGGRVVVLFGPDCVYEELHPIAVKYGTQCDWSADRLKGAIAGGGDAPRDSTGTRTERPAAHEVKCRK